MTTHVNIRRATPADIPMMIDLERACSTAAHWSAAQYQALFAVDTGSTRLALVAEPLSEPGSQASPALLGFLVARHNAPEWELENLVVVTAARRNGLGKRLLEALLAEAKNTNSAAVFLEVRGSNTAARALYEKVGFQQAGYRKSYYINPLEDALLYRWKPE